MKTLYKRIAHAIMALVMLVSLTATAFAAEAYSFTTNDEPAEIYATILRDHGKESADSYKYALLVYSDATNGEIIFNVDDYEIGPKAQYTASALQAAINHVADLTDPATIETETTEAPAETSNIKNDDKVDHSADSETQKFPDVKPDDWYYDAVNALTEGGLFTGYSDGLFHPDEPITVAQFATVFCRLYSLDTEFTENSGGGYISYEVPNIINGVLQNKNIIRINEKIFTLADHLANPHWGHGAVYNLATQTDQFGKIAPDLMDTPITRGTLMREMCIAITATRRNHDYPKTEIDMSKIPDANAFWVGDVSIMGPVYKTPDGKIIDIKIGSNHYGSPATFEHPDNYKLYAANCGWSYGYIKTAYEYGITTGVDDNHTANPNGLVTRAQFCQMLYNAGFTHADMNLCRNNGGLSGGSN